MNSSRFMVRLFQRSGQRKHIQDGPHSVTKLMPNSEPETYRSVKPYPIIGLFSKALYNSWSVPPNHVHKKLKVCLISSEERNEQGKTSLMHASECVLAYNGSGRNV
uniref:Uncharacterized protein n=2 Tax=Cacopsylla melanoneura TaxID=428564 RepID=A0A8D8QZV2_9HEMI